MKPLYLKGRTGLSVRLDGPALRIELPERAPTMYPLSRISRVIATVPVEWTTEALLACARQGITVSFLERGGDVVGHLFGTEAKSGDLYQCLIDLLDRPDWEDRYADWYRAMDSRARWALANRLRLPTDPPPAGHRLQVLLDAMKRRIAPPGVSRYVQRRLHGFLSALVAELLAEAGLSAERVRVIEPRIHLNADLVRLLAWDLHLPELNLLRRLSPRRKGTRPVRDADVVALFESRVPRLRHLGRTVINRLHGWAIELHR